MCSPPFKPFPLICLYPYILVLRHPWQSNTGIISSQWTSLQLLASCYEMNKDSYLTYIECLPWVLRALIVLLLLLLLLLLLISKAHQGQHANVDYNYMFCLVCICSRGFTENQCLHWVNPLLNITTITIIGALVLSWPAESRSLVATGHSYAFTNFPLFFI